MKSNGELLLAPSILGVTYFDNAPDYGDGSAEINLGSRAKEHRRSAGPQYQGRDSR